MATGRTSGHDGAMSDSPTAETGGFDPGRLRTAPTRMLRSRDDRYVAGVCGGLARYLNIDPVVVRVLIAALTVVGGVGLVLYVAAWLLAPEEGQDKNVLESHLPLSPRYRTLAWIVAGVLAVGAVVGSGPWFDWGWIGPLPLIALAVLIWILARPRHGSATADAATTDSAAPTTTSATSEAPAAGPTPDAPSTPDNPPPTPADPSTPDDVATAETPPAPAPQTPPEVDATDDTTRIGTTTSSDDAEAVGAADDTTRIGTSPADDRPTTLIAPLSPTPPPPPSTPPPPIPTPPPPPAPTTRPRDNGALTWLTLGALVAVIGVMRLIDQSGGDIDGPVYLAASLAVVAVGILVGTWWGNGRWLIPAGALLTVTLIGISQLPVWKLGEIREAPTRSADVLESYEMGAGRIELDLTRVEDLQALDGRTIEIDNGLGDVEVLVPDDLDVTVTAELNAGDIDILGREASGADASTQYTDLDDTDPDLRLDIDASLGKVEVTRP
jgi:phage shock protein PspC (stress-responsive transcriptional regulator)